MTSKPKGQNIASRNFYTLYVDKELLDKITKIAGMNHRSKIDQLRFWADTDSEILV